MTNRFYIVATIVFLSIGCSEHVIKSKTWLPPKNANGSACVQKCFLNRTNCSKTAKNFACDLQKIHQDSSPIREAKKQSDKLTTLDNKNCTTNPKCEHQYQQCYTHCGGQLIIHKELKTTW